MIRINEVLFTPEVEEKLWAEHELTTIEVRQVVHDEVAEAPRWEEHPEHWYRVIVRGQTKGSNPRMVYVALRPVDYDQGVWACITAFVPDDEDYGR